MNFKKPKQRVLAEAQIAAEDSIRRSMQHLTHSAAYDPNSVVNTLTMAISFGIAEALKVMMDNVYTDAEFEEDMTLREKE